MLKRLLYYKDFPLLAAIFLASLRISFFRLLKKEGLLLSPIPLKTLSFSKAYDREKITRYVNLCVFLRRKMGIRNTCFTYSVLLCYMLRRHGLDARIRFGVRNAPEESKENPCLRGHCWVVVKGDRPDFCYQPLFTYP